MVLEGLLALIVGASVNTVAGLMDGAIGTVGGGIIGNRADASLMWSCRALAKALKQQDATPMREILGKALWLSYLQALSSVCVECKTELVGQFEMKYRGQPNYPTAVRDDIRWLDQKFNQLSQEIRAIKKGNLAGVPEISWQALEALIASTNGQAGTQQGLRQSAISALVSSANDSETITPYKNKLAQLKTGLFERSCGFFAQQLAQDSALQVFFQNQLLMQISEAGAEQTITLQHVQQQLNDLSQVVPQQLNQALLTLESVEAQQTETNERTVLILEQGREVKELIETLIAVQTGEPLTEREPDNDATTETEYVLLRQVVVPNPFGPLGGRIDDPEQFFGRESVLASIFEILNSGSSVAIVGDKQMGKSSVLKAIEYRAKERLSVYREPIYIDLQLAPNEDDFYDLLCHQVGIETLKGFRLKRALESKRLLLLLDGLEKMTLDGFTEQVRSYLRGLAEGKDAPLQLVVAASEPLDKLFSVENKNMTSPVDGIYLQETLTPWDGKTIRSFIENRLQQTPIHFSEADILQIIQSSQGQPRQVILHCYRCYGCYQGQPQ